MGQPSSKIYQQEPDTPTYRHTPRGIGGCAVIQLPFRQGYGVAQHRNPAVLTQVYQHKK